MKITSYFIFILSLSVLDSPAEARSSHFFHHSHHHASHHSASHYAHHAAHHIVHYTATYTTHAVIRHSVNAAGAAIVHPHGADVTSYPAAMPSAQTPADSPPSAPSKATFKTPAGSAQAPADCAKAKRPLPPDLAVSCAQGGKPKSDPK